MAGDTKIRIIEAAEKIILDKGFNSVGLTEILRAASVPKGSFYYYFDSKEDFGVEVLKHYVAACKVHGFTVLENPETASEDPVQRILDYVDSLIDQTLENQEKCPCLVVKVNNEVASLSDEMRAVLVTGIRQCESSLTKALEEGIASGKIHQEIPAADMAAMINDSVNGALLRVEAIRSVRPLRQLRAFLESYLTVSH